MSHKSNRTDNIIDEIARLDFDGVRAVNWEIVVKKSEIILREHSKNLRIAVYMAYGLYETKGLLGFAVGLGILADMAEHFWQDLYPPLRRQRGRIGGVLRSGQIICFCHISFS